MSNQRRAPSSRSERGFTVIEVMIALLLLLIGMTGVALAQLQSLRSASNSGQRSKALYLAEEQLEVFHAMSFADPALGLAGVIQDPGNPLETDRFAGNNGSDMTQYYRCWVVLPNSPATGLTTIDVEVRVGDPNCNPNQVNPPIGTSRIRGIKG